MLEQHTLHHEDFKEFETLPDSYLFLSTDLNILNATDAYLRVTDRNREHILGKNVFEVFPDNPEQKESNGSIHLRKSLEYVLNNKVPHEMAVRRYDVIGKDGKFKRKYWKAINTPILDAESNVRYIINRVLDVTNNIECEDELGALTLRTKYLAEKIVEERRKLKEQEKELEQLQEADRYNEQRFKFLMENFPQITWISLPNGEVNFFNNTWFDYTGLSYEESKEWGFEKAIHPDDLQRSLDIYKNSLETGAPYKMEIRMKRAADQSYRWFYVQCHPLRNNQNEILHWIGTSTDIHDRKTAEEKARDLLERENDLHKKSEAQRQLLHELIMQAPVGMAILKGPEHVVEIGSPVFQKLVGGRNFTGKKVKDAIPELQGQVTLRIMDNVYQTGETFIGNEIPVLMARDENAPLEQMYFNNIYKAMRGPDNQIEGIFVFAYEVTEQVKARKLLEGINEKIQMILESLPMISWTSDSEGIVDYFNETWFKYTGMHPQEVEPWSQMKIVHPDDLPKAMQNWKEVSQRGTQLEIQYRLRRWDGMYRWHLGRSLPIRNKDGEIIKWVGTATDIHDQKIAADELSSKNKELNRINKDLDNFIYTASHDLKAPISNLEGLLNACGDAEDKEEEKPLFEMMYRSVDRLKNTIQDLTEIIYAQKRENEDVSVVNLEHLLSEIKDDINEMIERNSAQISTNFEVKEVRFSKKNLRSIIYNLLSNAIKYRSPDREPVIRIETIRRERFLYLSVSDNGLGMPKQSKDKIFGMFKRMHDHVEGTGIGLYIVKRMVENAGGTIEVESELGKGSKFTVCFRI